MSRTWWVNQGRSFERGVDALAVVWAPLANVNGGEVASWRQLSDVRDGDVLIHYARSAIRGFSVVNGAPYECKRPWLDHDDQHRDGRRVPVTFAALAIPVPLSEIPLALRTQGLPGPFNVNGAVKQGYLFPLDTQAAATVHEIIQLEVEEDTDEDGHRHALINGETERLGVARYRVEQPMLRRRALSGRSTAACDLCGEHYPAAFLVAAHIKKRASTSDRERRDPDNIMLACTFGCDSAFEVGALRVDGSGRIYLGPELDSTVARRLADVAGRVAGRFTPASKKYFAARESSFR